VITSLSSSVYTVVVVTDADKKHSGEGEVVANDVLLLLRS